MSGSRKSTSRKEERGKRVEETWKRKRKSAWKQRRNRRKRKKKEYNEYEEEEERKGIIG